MSVDKKTAKHICNVIRRQVLASFPDLYLHFIIHKENARKEEFLRETKHLKEHPAGHHFLKPKGQNKIETVINKNRSSFIGLAYENSPGFLGFFKHNNYVAISFINHERFSSEDNLRNHAFSIAWHAITLYSTHQNKDEETVFTDEDNLLFPNTDKQEIATKNLEGDVFSASVQKLLGREHSPRLINMQRINDTLFPAKGFRAEFFPFPVCIDTLEHVLNHDINEYQKKQKPVLTAVQITKEISKTYDKSTIEQWENFSRPAQKMAWSGHPLDTILGAALYTCENTYIQSTADMIAEKIAIKPTVLTTFNDYNPFAKYETNTELHLQRCKSLITNILSQVHQQQDYRKLVDLAWKQNNELLEGKALGWCATALIRATEMIKHCDDSSILPGILEHTETVFLSEIESIKWDTLLHFSDIIFDMHRSGTQIKYDDVIHIGEENDEFSSIHYAFSALKTLKQEYNDIEVQAEDNTSENIDIFNMVKIENIE